MTLRSTLWKPRANYTFLIGGIGTTTPSSRFSRELEKTIRSLLSSMPWAHSGLERYQAGRVMRY